MADEQNIRLTQPNGDLATTSYGPRTTNKNSPADRIMSPVYCQKVLQLDGDVQESYLQADADFDNDTRYGIPKGAFITDVFATSDTGASVTLGTSDINGNGSDANIGVLAPAAGAWAVLRAVDTSITEISHVHFALAAGERAVVTIAYIAPVEPGENGILAETLARDIA